MSVTVTQKPDAVQQGIQTYKLVCDGEDCDWQDKAYEKQAHSRAMGHIIRRHGGNGGVRLVRD